MSTLAEIEEAVAKLPLEQFSELLRRMQAREAVAWDRQIERDSESGALDVLLQEVSDDIALGRTRAIDEVCRDS